MIVEANLRAGTLLGINRQKLIGRPLSRFFASEDQDIFRRHCQDVLKTGTRQTREMRLRNKAGATSWVHLESLAMHDKPGPITHWRTALLDISDRKRAEQTKNLLIKDLNRSQEYFRALFNWTPSAVGISTVAEGRLCDVNEGLSRLTGYAREELIGRTTLELGLWADPSERAIVLRELQEQGSLHNREGLLRTKSGEIRSLMVSVESIQLGDTPCLIYLGHDITERKRAEEALRLAKFLMDRAADAVYWIDPQARILDANEAASLMLGYSKDELCAMTVHDLNPDFQADMWPGYWAETRRPGTKVMETCHRAKNGRLIPIEVSVNFLSYEGKEYHCAFVRDITERKQAEVFLAAEKKVLELIATGTELSELLDTLMREIEAQSTDGMLCSVLLADEKGQRLLHGAAPSLPEAYNEAVHGLVIGPSAGSCGTAAFERKPVFVTDIAADPRWADFNDLAAAHGLGACHSTPILSSQGRLLGTIAMYYRRPHNPGAHDRQLIEQATQLAGIAIERRQVEEALRRSEAFITSVVENLPNMVFVKKAKDLTFVSFNKAGEDLLGHSRDTLIGKSDYDFFPKEQADFFAQKDQQVFETGGLVDITEEPIETKHQGRRILHTRKIPIYDETGEPQYLLGISEDITERRQIEVALRESEERYRSIFENAVEGIFQTTLDGKYVAVNPALARMYGYDSPDDMIAAITNIADQLYVDPGRRDEFIRLMQSQKAVTGFEALVYRKDGSFIWISENVRELRDQAGVLVGYEGTVEQITQRKLAEQRLRDTLDQVRMLSGRVTTVQEEERTRIARELHDELGVGLTCLKIDLSRLHTIVGEGTGGRARKKVGDKIRSMVELIDTTIASVQRLVTELRPALLDDLGLVAAIEWQCQDFQTRTGIPCTCVTSADDIAMEPARATALFRICQEALTNTARHAQATAVTVMLESWNNSLRLVVADNGVGIPDTKVSNHQSLGLIGMRERVALFGGEITIQGHPEKGTTVTACLPRCLS